MPEAPQYTVAFSAQFQQEFRQYPEDQRLKVVDFIDLYEAHGLSDFSKFPGKIAKSDKIPGTDPDYDQKLAFTRQHNLWHYHCGLPTYEQGLGPYLTSKWVIHFRVDSKVQITIVDMYEHYKADGTFYLPPISAL